MHNLTPSSPHPFPSCTSCLRESIRVESTISHSHPVDAVPNPNPPEGSARSPQVPGFWPTILFMLHHPFYVRLRRSRNRDLELIFAPCIGPVKVGVETQNCSLPLPSLACTGRPAESGTERTR